MHVESNYDRNGGCTRLRLKVIARIGNEDRALLARKCPMGLAVSNTNLDLTT